jgi:hypothetical protein
MGNREQEWTPTLNIAEFYTAHMRFLIRAKIPTEDGNKMVQDPTF